MARQNKTHDPFRWFDTTSKARQLVIMAQVVEPERLESAKGRFSPLGSGEQADVRATATSPDRRDSSVRL